MKKFSYIYLLLFLFISCSGTAQKSNNPDINMEVSIIRFDNDIYEYLQSPDKEKEDILKQKYPALLPAFAQIAVNSEADVNDSKLFSDIQKYFSHPMLQKIYDDELKTFKDVTIYEQELTKAKEIAIENLPQYVMPKFAIHVSGFKENTIIVDNTISISGDKYLGYNNNNYSGFFEPYQRQQMEPKFITRDLLRAWLMTDILHVNNDKQEDLLSAMATEGKILYILSVLLPEYDRNDLIGYRAEQSAWCKENEKMIWQKMVKQDNLFTKDHMIITRYINDAPYTSTISKESPGRIGSWIGWQMVDQYVKKNGISLSELIKTEPTTILKDSKYNP